MEDIFLESSRAEFWLDSQVLLLCSSSKAYLEFPVKMALDVFSLLPYHWEGKRKKEKKKLLMMEAQKPWDNFAFPKHAQQVATHHQLKSKNKRGLWQEK